MQVQRTEAHGPTRGAWSWPLSLPCPLRTPRPLPQTGLRAQAGSRLSREVSAARAILFLPRLPLLPGPHCHLDTVCDWDGEGRASSIWNFRFWFLLRVTVSKSPNSFINSLTVPGRVPAPRAYILGLEGRRPSDK